MSKAKIRTEGLELTVDFNPASLKLSVTNSLQGDPPNGQQSGTAVQQTRRSTAKLETELVLDSTESGQDVRDKSKVLRAMARAKSWDDPASSRVTFKWGVLTFVGLIESLSETLDFWSGDGVPLRATVQITMQSIDFDLANPAATAPEPETAVAPVPSGASTTDVAQRAGNAAAGPALAAANGLESMRMVAGGAIVVQGGVQLKAAAAFSAGASAGFGGSASAGFGAGASAGFGGSASAGFGAGASAGFGASASAGFGGSASAGFGGSASAGLGGSAGASAGAGFGASASAGVTAVGGAFSGIGVSKRLTTSMRLDPARLLPPPGTRAIGTGASFDATGRVVATGSAGLSASVEGAAGARVRLI
jgi:hypothetical protein